MRKAAVAAIVAGVIVAIIAASLTTYYLSSAARHEQARTPGARTVTVVDVLGRKVTIKVPVKRVVVAHDLPADYIQILGVQDRVVGVAGIVKRMGIYPRLADKPVIGWIQWRINYEKVAELKPDLVIFMDVGPVQPIISKLEKIGIKCLVVSIRPSKVPYSIKLLGKVFGKERRAEEFIKWWDKQVSILKDRLRGVNKNYTAFVGILGKGIPGRIPLRTYGKGAYWNYWFRILHIKNIADSVLSGRSGTVSAEWIIKENPDIIIVGDWLGTYGLGYHCNLTVARHYLMSLKTSPIYSKLKAVVNGRVFIVHRLMLVGPKSIAFAYYLAKMLYPSKFKDFNLSKFLNEMFSKWYGVKYRGAWFYPQACGVRGTEVRG